MSVKALHWSCFPESLHYYIQKSVHLRFLIIYNLLSVVLEEGNSPLKIISQYLYFIFWNIQPVIKGLWQFGSHLLTYNKNITGNYRKNT